MNPVIQRFKNELAAMTPAERDSAANHSPETVIITRLRKDMEWQQFWHFVGR